MEYNIKEKIEDINQKLINIESQKTELLLEDLFYKSKIILNHLQLNSFYIEPLSDEVAGDIFENFPIHSIQIYDKKNETYHDFNSILEKSNLSISDLEIGPLLKKTIKINHDMNLDDFKLQFQSNKNKNKIKIK